MGKANSLNFNFFYVYIEMLDTKILIDDVFLNIKWVENKYIN